MRLLLFLLIGFSVTNSIVFLHVFAGLRDVVSGIDDTGFYAESRSGLLIGFREAFIGRLFRCHACMGFWVGLVMSICFGGFVCRYWLVDNVFILACLDAFLLSGFNFIVWVVLRRLGSEEL